MCACVRCVRDGKVCVCVCECVCVGEETRASEGGWSRELSLPLSESALPLLSPPRLPSVASMSDGASISKSKRSSKLLLALRFIASISNGASDNTDKSSRNEAAGPAGFFSCVSQRPCIGWRLHVSFTHEQHVPLHLSVSISPA